MAQAVRAVGAQALTRATDTIFALSSGRPPAAIAIIRISGGGAMAVAGGLMASVPQARRPALRALRDSDGRMLDRALVLRFDGPASSTGEDMIELHLHGGRAVVEAVEEALAIGGMARRAEPGEFTRRAFHNGRIDLIEAEGLADLLAAETQAQRRHALEAAEGHVSRRLEDWRSRLIALSARAEAQIDFDEEDGVWSDPLLVQDVETLANEVAIELAKPGVDRLRDAVTVVLAGPVNAGKSSLFNALIGRDGAIVSAQAGTTRDRIEAEVLRDGIAYRLVDTAGLRSNTQDAIELEGMDRSRRALTAADMVLWLGDDEPVGDRDFITLWPRCDLVGREKIPDGRLAVSMRDDRSIGAVWQKIAAGARRIAPDSAMFTVRQRTLLAEFVEALRPSGDAVLLAAGLQAARDALDRVIGRAGVDEMLDALFARFCLGK